MAAKQDHADPSGDASAEALYLRMRELVPDLALPLDQRLPMTAEQQSAIDAYETAKDRARAARLARREPRDPSSSRAQ